MYCTDNGERSPILFQDKTGLYVTTMPDVDKVNMTFKEKRRIKSSYELMKIYVLPEEIKELHMPVVSKSASKIN